jgi:mono/diheme cytochrome c family protein
MKRAEIVATALVFVFAWATNGCSKKEQQDTTATTTATATATTPTTAAPPSAPANAAAEAKGIFNTRCVVCHGDHGAGDGPGAAAIVPKPRAFADAEWQASVTDEHIQKIIVEGGPAVGKSPGMPPNPDLQDKDEVVSELVKVVRSFKK